MSAPTTPATTPAAATVLPYGSWPSPITPDLITAGSVGLSGPVVDGEATYWLESRADQGGRGSIWRRDGDGTRTELTPDWYVRTAVHEYGGGAWAVVDGVLVWSSFPDGRLWVKVGDEAPRPLTAEDPRLRFGDLRVHPARSLVLAVREEHAGAGSEAVNTIVTLDLGTDNPDGGTVLCAGHDFYSTPELSLDDRLAWTQWDHPDMPWDATAVMVAPFDTDALGEPVQVAGGPGESAVQPRWLPDGGLVFCSDRSDWWNLYRWRDGAVTALAPAEAEFCAPQWGLGAAPYAVLGAESLLASWHDDAGSHLGVLDLVSGSLDELDVPGTEIASVSAAGSRLVLLVGSPSEPDLIIASVGDDWQELRRSSEVSIDPAVVSIAEPVTWPGAAGVVHGWFYPPTNAAAAAPAGTLPPLITKIHGGPTAAARTSLSLETQYWTSRGFAVLDVDYSGSTGYGRAYRERLKGVWGELDVTDCADGARAMAEQGRADGARLAIMGGSAGGYTVLRALTYTTTFAAGVSLYGVGDLTALATDTHKFESRYLDGLIGPYPQDAATYEDRSPIHHVDDLACPILLLQGADDKVVPPNQAETFAAAARAKGLPVAMIVFAGEGHGFRRAENIRASLEARLSFYGEIFGFTPADDLPILEIENLPHAGS